MFIHPQFDPIAFQLGPLAVRWYGLMYLVGFAAGLLLGRLRIQRASEAVIDARGLDDLLFYMVIGVVVGGRLGHVLFYEFAYYLEHPLDVFAVWKGGMSFHGGLLGAMAAMAWFARKQGKGFLAVADFVAPLVPPGLAAGRLGNFINAELWGRPTEVPWGMVFPNVDTVARHPSQLYEFALEGVALFVILWVYSRKPRPVGTVSALFLVGYGLFRFLVEFTREPDGGRLYAGLSLGQWYSVPMLLAGLLLWLWARRR